MSINAKMLNVPNIEKTLDRIPLHLSEADQDLLCDAMKLVVTGDSEDREEKAMLQAQATEMVRLMHQCMHLGPRVCGLVAMNCLVSLDLVLSKAVPDQKERLSVHSAIVAHAVQISTVYSASDTTGQTKH